MYANFWEGLLDDGRSVNRTWYVYSTDTQIANTDVQAVGRLRLGATDHTVLVSADALWSHDVNPTVEGAATPLDVYTPTYGTFALPPVTLGDSPATAARQVGLTVQDQIKNQAAGPRREPAAGSGAARSRRLARGWQR